MDVSEQEVVVARFLQAAWSGDLQSLMDVLAPDVVLVTDGGGVRSALRPILGREKVLRLLAGVMPDGVDHEVDLTRVVVNGRPGVRLEVDGALDTIGTLLVEDGVVTGLCLVRNPAKLGRTGALVALTR